MRDKTCFNCSNDHACVDCVCFNKWQARDVNYEVKPFTIKPVTPPVEHLLAFNNFKPILNMLNAVFGERG